MQAAPEFELLDVMMGCAFAPSPDARSKTTLPSRN